MQRNATTCNEINEAVLTVPLLCQVSVTRAMLDDSNISKEVLSLLLRLEASKVKIANAHVHFLNEAPAFICLVWPGLLFYCKFCNLALLHVQPRPWFSNSS